jgi:hypothetical protein
MKVSFMFCLLIQIIQFFRKTVTLKYLFFFGREELLPSSTYRYKMAYTRVDCRYLNSYYALKYITNSLQNLYGIIETKTFST